MEVLLLVKVTLTEGKGGRSVLIDPHGIEILAQCQAIVILRQERLN